MWKSGGQRLGVGRFRYQRSQSNDTESIELRYQSPYASDVALVHTKESNDYPREPKQWRSGWRFGAINCALAASIVFLINLVVTIWGSVRRKSNGNVLYEGDCDQVDRINRALHLLINLLSTVLLSSSNYCMQCLSAPTRKEVDKAHAKRVWLDIGVPSIRNLVRISRKRRLLWLLLGLSSLPLHLFYNSAVFSSISVNDYYAISVSQSFIEDADCLGCDSIKYVYKGEPIPMMWKKAKDNTLDRLSNADCIEQYAKILQSKRRNVLLVTHDDKLPPLSETREFNGTHVHALEYYGLGWTSNPIEESHIYSWICSGLRPGVCTTQVNDLKNVAGTWRVSGIPVDYCLSERAEQRCKLQYVHSIAILVTLLNLLKAILIFYTAFGTKEEPLMTMGDAVACFLENKDLTTKNTCLLSVHDVKKSEHPFPVGAREWVGEQRRWKDATSLRRRITTIFMFTITVIGVIALFGYGVVQMPIGTQRSLPSLARLGYGAIDTRAIIKFPKELTTVQNVLVANVAQPILSFLYFSYNGLFTCMLLGYEWSTYAHHKKGLRVSRSPEGAQRSTYFLQLPYRFALPLMALSGILHWLVSQSIFLVAIDAYDWEGTELSGNNWKSCGYSPIAIFTVIIMGSLMVAAIIGFGFVPYKRGINLVGSCSAAISAACHLGDDEVDGHTAARKKLQWGVVGVNAEGVGHCAFSTKEVEFPKKGMMYAG